MGVADSSRVSGACWRQNAANLSKQICGQTGQLPRGGLGMARPGISPGEKTLKYPDHRVCILYMGAPLEARPCGPVGLENQADPTSALIGTAREVLQGMRQSLGIKDPTRAPRELGRRLHLAARRDIVPQKTAIITALTTSRPLCMTCVSSRAGLSTAEVEAVFRSIQEVLRLRRGDGRCRACGTVGPVFSVDDARSSSPPPPCRAATPPRSL